MSNKRTVLVVADFDSDALLVTDRAILVANTFGCDLDILFCDSNDSAFVSRFILSSDAAILREHVLTMQQEFTESLAERARQAGLTATATVLNHRPIGDGILARVVETDPLLVMKGTEFHSSAKRSIMVDTDWQLLRTCPYPLWLVKQVDFRERPVVVAAVDPLHEHDKPAHLDHTIVRSAGAIASPLGGALHLLHTYQRIAAIGRVAAKTLPPVKLPINEVDKRIKQQHREALDAIAKDYDIDAEHTHQLPGRTKDILPAFVRSRKADLVVMGAIARWGLRRMVIGSTAERVLDHLPCDVLIVRDNEHQIVAATGATEQQRFSA